VAVQPDAGDEALFDRFRADFDAKLDSKPSDSFVYVFGHPCRWGTPRWWGQDQWAEYHDGRVVEPDDLQPVRERYSPAQVDRLLAETEQCIEWVMKRDDLTPTTYAEVNEACAESTAQWLSPADLKRAAADVGDTFTYSEVAGTTLSPADLLAALAWVLVRENADGTLPERVPLRRPLGPLSEPLAATGEAPITRAAARGACYKLDLAVERTGALPSRMALGDSHLGPADLLRVCCQLVVEGLDSASLRPGTALPEVATAQCFEETRFASWSYPPGFEPVKLARLAKWQSWSLRPAIMRW